MESLEPTPPQTIGIQGKPDVLSWIENLKEEMLADPAKLNSSFPTQARFIREISEVYVKPGVTRETRKIILQTFCSLFPETQLHHRPQDRLKDILILPSSTDAEISLKIHLFEHQNTNYQPDENEKLYLNECKADTLLGRYIRHAMVNHVNLGHHFWAGLLVLSTIVRRNFYISGMEGPTWLNQYVILTGPKGEGKTAAMKVATRVLERMNRIVEERFGSPTVEGMTPSQAFYQTNIFEDTTEQGLIKALSEISKIRYIPHIKGNPARELLCAGSGTLMIDELTIFLGKGVHDIDKKINFLVTAATKDYYEKRTKVGGVERIHRMYLSMLALSDPVWFRNSITQDAQEGGFVDRTQFIHRTQSSRRYTPYISGEEGLALVDPVVSESLAREMLKILIGDQDGAEVGLDLTLNGQDCMHDFYTAERNLKDRGERGDKHHTVERTVTEAMKIAALLAVSEGTQPYIHSRHLEFACKVMEAEYPNYQEFRHRVSNTYTDDLDAKAEDILNTLEEGEYTKRTAMRQRLGCSNKDIQALERGLVGKGVIKVTKIHKNYKWEKVGRKT